MNSKVLWSGIGAMAMATTPLQNRLDGILLLLVMNVSLLSGLVFGRGHDDRIGITAISFLVLGVTILALSIVRAHATAE